MPRRASTKERVSANWRELLGGGVLCGGGTSRGGAGAGGHCCLAAQPRRTTPVLFEPAFSHRDVRVRVDAYRRGPRGRHADRGEVDHEAWPEHIWDCAIQTRVARGSGRNVTKIELAHLIATSCTRARATTLACWH